MEKIINIRFLYIFLFFSFSANAQWVKHSFEVMGTLSQVEFWLDDPKTTQGRTPQLGTIGNDNRALALIQLVKQEMIRIDQKMSPYKEKSELSKINREAPHKAVPISVELFDLLNVAQDISILSDGSFDITYASVGYQYDFREKKRPNQTDINQTLPAINYTSVILNDKDNTVYFTNDAVKIDLGGIAKGYAVKRCLSLLAKAGIKHALVSAGGDTGLLGDRHGRPWLVGIKHPRAEYKTAVNIPLENEAISTSGDYERYFIEDGVRYHHIINPKTGDSSRKVMSVSVIGKDPTYVDALSTTIFVKGLSDGLALIEKLPDFEVIIIDNEQRMHYSKGLQQ
ncbi:FAD:protein FMN transferase [Colwellia sp. MSW7]|uniref:FAD:protein FMN transferase n=1 Tax=Colwellia maritima TaxID=2912588 RepID=A0ABS9X2J6_9GAMM|nr:FAD:protein FMN transferase [Colwellia maritima]MCI2284474.1 FAD:protein FMN transferase [Colwellia maritima]